MDFDLIWYPHDVLRNKSVPLTLEQVKTDSFRQILSRMFLIMYRLGGVGLAAPQVGFNVNLIIGNPDGREFHDSSSFALINPLVTPSPCHRLVTQEEGCLSLPGIYAPVTRPDKINVRFLDISGVEEEFQIGGFTSRIIQHEYDHLNGIMFIDLLDKSTLESINDTLEGHLNKVKSVRNRRARLAKKERAKKGKRRKRKKRC